MSGLSHALLLAEESKRSFTAGFRCLICLFLFVFGGCGFFVVFGSVFRLV